MNLVFISIIAGRNVKKIYMKVINIRALIIINCYRVPRGDQSSLSPPLIQNYDI